MSLRISLFGLTDTGKVRRRNEDALAMDPERGIAMVADGMGGHPGGDVASRVAVTFTLERLQDLHDAVRGKRSTSDLAGAMSNVVLGAHEAIRERGRTETPLEGMGTTLTVLMADLDHRTWVLSHVGDSRAYLLRRGELRQLTRDDTWVQQRVDAADLTPEQAKHHPFGHMLTQCLGLEKTPRPHVREGILEDGDVFLLCTDGLTGMVERARAEAILRSHMSADAGDTPALEAVAHALIQEALDQGGQDNVTVVLLTVG